MKKTFLLTYNPDNPKHRREKNNRFHNEMAAADKGERVDDWDNDLTWDGIPVNVGARQAVTRWNSPAKVEVGSMGLLLWQGNAPKFRGIFGLVEAVTEARKIGGKYYALWKLDARYCVQPEENGGPIIPTGELVEKLGWKDNANVRRSFKIKEALPLRKPCSTICVSRCNRGCRAL